MRLISYYDPARCVEILLLVTLTGGFQDGCQSYKGERLLDEIRPAWKVIMLFKAIKPLAFFYLLGFLVTVEGMAIQKHLSYWKRYEKAPADPLVRPIDSLHVPPDIPENLYGEARSLKTLSEESLLPGYIDLVVKPSEENSPLAVLYRVAISAAENPEHAEDVEICRRWRVWWDATHFKNKFDMRSDAERLAVYARERLEGTLETTPERATFELVLILGRANDSVS